MKQDAILVDIIEDGDVTMANLQHSGTEASGHAKVCEPDTFDPKVGEDLALGRALVKMGRQLIREAYDDVHQKDKQRQRQEEASAASLAKRLRKDGEFQLEFATLIKELHPDAFQPTKVRSQDLYNRADLPA